MNLKAKVNDKTIIAAIVFTGSLFILAFKIKHSIGFINLDEFLWMYRSRFFIDGILAYDFSGLIQSAQPGIMVMWFSGPFMKLIDYDFSSIQRMIEKLSESGGYNVINDTSRNFYAGYEHISFMFNVPIIFLMAAFFGASYWLMRKLGIERRAVFLSLVLIATTPYYVFFTTPTDKLVGIFSTLSLLSLLVYLKKMGGRKFMVISGILASWAALTKMSALFLVPFVSFSLFAYGLNSNDPSDPRTFRKKAAAGIRDISCWLSVFIITSVIFLPTIIAFPAKVAALFVEESASRSLVQSSQGLLFLESIKRYLEDPFLLTFNIFAIIVFAVFPFFIIRRREYKINLRKEILLLYFFIFSFFIFLAFFSRTYSFRYMIPALVVFQVVTGIAIYEFSEMFGKKNAVYSRNEIYAWAIVFILVSQALLIHYSEIAPII